jgi:hypothetical protein
VWLPLQSPRGPTARHAPAHLPMAWPHIPPPVSEPDQTSTAHVTRQTAVPPPDPMPPRAPRCTAHLTATPAPEPMAAKLVITVIAVFLLVPVLIAAAGQEALSAVFRTGISRPSHTALGDSATTSPCTAKPRDKQQGRVGFPVLTRRHVSPRIRIVARAGTENWSRGGGRGRNSSDTTPRPPSRRGRFPCS